MEGGGMGVTSGVQPAESWEAALADKVAQLALNHESDLPAVGGEAPGEAGAQHVLPAEASGVVVDHALRDALSHPKNRAAVLKLEEEVETFVLNSQDPQYVFSRDMTSYERLLAHRTAQHWGLETTTISQGPDQGKIVAYRAAFTQMPKVKLANLPVTMTDLPAPAPNASPASPAPAPRVLVRKRPERLGPRGGPGSDMYHSGGGGGMGPFPDGAGPGGFRSVEERQAEYHRARARIFGGGPGSPGGVPADVAYNMAQPIHLPHRAQLYGAGGLPTSPGGSPFPMSPPRAVAGAGFSRPAGSWGGGGMGGSSGGGGGNGGGGRKAVLRNKHEDLNDPDFRRHRHSGPRFDPGFGEEPESQRSMYIRPTYSSEFPELGGQPSPSSGRGGRGAGGRGAQQSPRRGGPMQSPMAGGGMPMAGGVGSPGGMYGGWQPMGPAGQVPGMMAAGPMGPFMMPPGMVMAGPMPGMGAGMVAYSPGGTAMSFHPAAAGYYPMPPYGYYPMQPGAAGGVQDGMPYAMPYAAAAYPGMGGPGAAAAMGGFPGGPAAAAAMAAMASPMPMPLSPQHSGGPMHPGGGISRQRSNGARSRGSGGGGGGGHSSGSLPQTLGSLPDASQHTEQTQHSQEAQHSAQPTIQEGQEQQRAQQAETGAGAATQQ